MVEILGSYLKIVIVQYLYMTDYTYCKNCDIFIPYIKDLTRYVTCPKCRQDLYVGTEKLYRKGKHKRTKTT